MTDIAEFTVEGDKFPLGSVFGELPDATIELERFVPTKEALIPYFWLRDARSDDIVAAFLDHPHLLDVSLVDEVDGEYLLRVDWDSGAEGLLQAIIQTDITLLSAVGTSQEWRFEVRADQADDLSAFQVRCREFGVPITLVNLQSLTPMRRGTGYGLTETQREAMVLAWERGFYHSPRKVSLDELADELDITGQSLGSRLRRGTHRLIGNTLITSETDR